MSLLKKKTNHEENDFTQLNEFVKSELDHVRERLTRLQNELDQALTLASQQTAYINQFTNYFQKQSEARHNQIMEAFSELHEILRTDKEVVVSDDPKASNAG